jgi:hypothetical protein
MKFKLILFLTFLNLASSPVFAQNEQDLQSLSIFSEYVKAKNYDSAYAPWMELRQRNPRFNKAIFVYGERILKYKIKNTTAAEKTAFINDMIKLWEERATFFPSVTPKGDIHG